MLDQFDFLCREVAVVAFVGVALVVAMKGRSQTVRHGRSYGGPLRALIKDPAKAVLFRGRHHLHSIAARTQSQVSIASGGDTNNGWSRVLQLLHSMSITLIAHF